MGRKGGRRREERARLGASRWWWWIVRSRADLPPGNPKVFTSAATELRREAKQFLRAGAEGGRRESKIRSQQRKERHHILLAGKRRGHKLANRPKILCAGRGCSRFVDGEASAKSFPICIRPGCRFFCQLLPLAAAPYRKPSRPKDTTSLIMSHD